MVPEYYESGIECLDLTSHYCVAPERSFPQRRIGLGISRNLADLTNAEDEMWLSANSSEGRSNPASPARHGLP